MHVFPSSAPAGVTSSSPGSLTVRVLMMGESLSNCGGVVEVQKIILNYLNTIGDRVIVQHIPTVSNRRGEPIWPKLKTFLNALFQFSNCILNDRFDIAHIHFTERGSIARVMVLMWLCQLGRKPYILHHHGAEFKEFFAALPRPIQQVVRGYFAKAVALLVLTKSWQTYFVEEFGLSPQQVNIFMNPVELPAESSVSAVPADRVAMKFVSLGRIGQRKGTFDLIKAFAQVCDRLPPQTTLAIAGDGEVAQAQQLIDDLGLGDRIKLLGWLDKPGCNELLAQATAFVLPSYNEGLPLAILEAMSWGIPVITTPVGGIPDVITPDVNGLLVTPGNIQQIADALLTLGQDAALRVRLGTQARHDVQPLSAHHYSTKIAGLYEQLVNVPDELFCHQEKVSIN